MPKPHPILGEVVDEISPPCGCVYTELASGAFAYHPCRGRACDVDWDCLIAQTLVLKGVLRNAWKDHPEVGH